MPFSRVIVINSVEAEVFHRWEDAPHPGVFTSFRALSRDGQMHVPGLPLHYERLISGCLRFGVTAPSLEGITSEILRGMDELHLKEARVRVELFRDFQSIRIGRIDPLEFDAPSITLRTLSVSRPYEDLKSSYGAAVSERYQSQCDPDCEVLYVDPHGFIIEGAWSNFGWIDSTGTVCFTGRGLDGVTQRLITAILTEAGRDVRVRHARLSDLLDNGIAPFISSALRGILPVSKMNEVSFALNEELLDIRRRYVDATCSSVFSK